jgi:hypothetical protein
MECCQESSGVLASDKRNLTPSPGNDAVPAWNAGFIRQWGKLRVLLPDESGVPMAVLLPLNFRSIGNRILRADRNKLQMRCPRWDS